MSRTFRILLALGVLVLALVGYIAVQVRGPVGVVPTDQTSGPHPKLVDPVPQSIPAVHIAKPVGWQPGEAPTAAPGLTVTRFAEGLDHPRSVLVLPNGDVLVAETNAPAGERMGGGLTEWIASWLFAEAGAGGPSPNKLVLLRDSQHSGHADQRFELTNPALDSPFGLVWHDGRLYVANHNALLAWPFTPGQTALSGKPAHLADLPAAGMHWTRNLALSEDGKQLYIAVGASTNIAEHGIDAEDGRAQIDEFDLATGKLRAHAGGMRNPVGMDINPRTGELWTVVNERDLLGPDLVPDYLTAAPFAANYGWPWAYWKNHLDWRVEAPTPDYLMDYVRKPAYGLGAHVAPLGLVFARGGLRLGARFASGAFVARHGSWNRRPLAGYDVVFVPFDSRGQPLPLAPQPVLSGFLTPTDQAHGRPTMLATTADGALLVSDDVGGVIWRVIAPNAAPAPDIVRIPDRPLPPLPKMPPKFHFEQNPNSTLLKPGA